MAIKKAIILTIFEVSRFMTFDIIFSIFCPQCTKLSLNHYLSLIFQTPWASLGMASEMSNFRSHQKSLWWTLHIPSFQFSFQNPPTSYVVARVYHTLQTASTLQYDDSTSKLCITVGQNLTYKRDFVFFKMVKLCWVLSGQS